MRLISLTHDHGLHFIWLFAGSSFSFMAIVVLGTTQILPSITAQYIYIYVHMIGESFACIVLGHIRRFSFSKQDQHHRMLILGINFCPCKNSLIETLFCTYCYYVHNKSSKLHETDFFSLALRSKVQVRRELVQPTLGMRLIGQLWRA